VLRGGDGADTIDLASGGGTAYGDSGDDAIWVAHPDLGNPFPPVDYGDATLEGGLGADTVSGSGGHDLLTGGEGDDLLSGDPLYDIFGLTGGYDSVSGGSGHDIIYGGLLSDALAGGSGNDTMTGGTRFGLSPADGADELNGGAGDDSLAGGIGDDRVILGDGADTAIGGPGFDTLVGSDDGMRDHFVLFDTSHNRGDRIFGFESAYDVLSIEFVSDAMLVAGADPVAVGAGPVLLYDTDTGRLSHDPDGDGSLGADLITVLIGAPSLSSDNIVFT
jgi:Ca2+-binding RTX toxin-like protein